MRLDARAAFAVHVAAQAALQLRDRAVTWWPGIDDMVVRGRVNVRLAAYDAHRAQSPAHRRSKA